MNWSSEQLVQLATTYGIPVLKALAILVVGWLVAKAVSAVLVRILKKTEFDNRIASYVTRGRSTGQAVETGVGKLVYWLILLFVFMAVFQVLGLTIITEPINALVTKITSFLPNLLAAAALGALAWVVASVVRVLVSNLLTAFDLDRKIDESTGKEIAAEGPDEEGAARKVSLGKTVADGLYYLVFLLFLPQVLDALAMDGLEPVSDMVGRIIGFLPNLLGAAVVFAVFYFVAKIVQRLATNLLAAVGFDRLPVWLGIDSAVDAGRSASVVAGYVVFALILFLGAVQAFNTLGLVLVSGLVDELFRGLVKVLIACVIFGFGLFLSRLAYNAIAAGGKNQSRLFAMIARVAILVFTGTMALYRADLAPQIVELAFGALIVGLALAAGLAFGLGGRDAAADVIASWRSKTSNDDS